MLRTMNSATNTMAQLQQQLDMIGNNLANSNTHGFKAKEAKFGELLYQQFNNDKLDKAERQSPVGIRIGVGAQLAQAQTVWKQGSMQTTDRSLDFAFTKPKQYLNVIMPEGENGERTVYTRQGNLYISTDDFNNAMLVTSEGYPVAGADGNPIVFPENVKDFGMKENGELNITFDDGSQRTVELAVTELQRPQLMEHISGAYIGLPDNLNELGVTEADVLRDLQGADRAEIGLQNGALEMSNVDTSKEMTELINTQRSYQFNARTITLSDQMLGLINGIR
ncbi:flagellar hook-basal body protein [Viridibacillus sp. YIM B01967]|uniref:Flagellar hook-basal body protein n=1 Tax=Viridibacillus soli TaxID=2798301 RepID=A0ABS1H9C1_9BACL|nr:flagellar hook-basal body protein [Viridibacillus soli]MBK3495618.1 flagellar hook-basal body protein [Viridibacillus soli]